MVDELDSEEPEEGAGEGAFLEATATDSATDPKNWGALAEALKGTAKDFTARMKRESKALETLRACEGLDRGESKRLRRLQDLAQQGLDSMLYSDGSRRRRRFNLPALADYKLVIAFVRYGARAALKVASPRAGDFLNNQLRGQWAERVVLSLTRRLDDIVFVPFGPSSAAMPGDDRYRELTAAYREIVLVEGKRPDLLAFDGAVWSGLAPGDIRRTESWPERLLVEEDMAIVRRGMCGAEVKCSTWHYAKRREAGGSPLAVTAKEEELADFEHWERETGLPVVFFQVLFDEIYCMSFARMLAAIDRGFLYTSGDYVLDRQTGGGGKVFHRFKLVDFKHLFGSVVFPNDSRGVIRVLQDGSVVPFLEYLPAEAEVLSESIFREEVGFRHATSP